MKLCMGCMEQIDDKQSVCPYCGFNEKNNSQESYCLPPGSIISGKYIVGRSIGYSGQIISYIGMDAETNKKIVIKEYLPGDFATRSEGETDITIYSGDAKEQFDNGLSRFLNEASGVQSLGSVDGIVRVADCVIENDTGYVITDYIKGNTLKTILDSGKKYSLSEAVPIVACLLSGLSRVHQMNIIHCDIAPENIIIDERGGVSLDNFGAARYVTSSNSKSLAILLKQGYAAEEQYRASGKRGPWTDVYGIAAVLYRMITGVVPQESVERTLNDELKAPSKLGISIPDNIENALMNALNIYQEERTQTTNDFLKELSSSSVKRRVSEKTKKDTGKIPLWGKISIVACFSLLVIGGIAIGIWKGKNSPSGDGPSADQIIVKDEKKNKFAELKYDDLDISTEYVYDADHDKSGTVKSQSVSGYVDKNSQVVFYVYSDERLGYAEIRDNWSMSALVMKDKVTGLSDDKYEEDKNCDGFDYGKIISIKTKDGSEIDVEDIKSNNANIKIDDIDSIKYQARSFFYWEKFPEFIGKKLSEIEEQPLYIKKGDTPTEDGKGKIEEAESLVDKSWYSFDFEEGYIFSQENVNEKVDMSNPPDHPLVNAIGQKLTKAGTAKDLKAKLEEQGFKVEIDGSENNNVTGVDVEYTGSDDKTTVLREKDNGTAFKRDPNIKITIKAPDAAQTSSPAKNTSSDKSTRETKKPTTEKEKSKPRTTEKEKSKPASEQDDGQF